MARFSSYSDRYGSVHLERSDDGILEIRIHRNGGPATWHADKGGIHEELGDAFYQVSRDPDNKIVIFTGTGDSFITKLERGAEAFDHIYWDRIYKEGKDLLQNLLDIDVPVIGAVNGPAFVHAELVTMSDIVIASSHAVFADKAHAPAGVVPADGVHVWWPMLLGPNRGRHFLLTGAEISAEEAKRLGFVAEVVPPETLMQRARELAGDLLKKPEPMRRNARIAMTQHIKRRMLDDLGYGLMLEGMAFLAVKEGQ